MIATAINNTYDQSYLKTGSAVFVRYSSPANTVQKVHINIAARVKTAAQQIETLLADITNATGRRSYSASLPTSETARSVKHT